MSDLEELKKDISTRLDSLTSTVETLAKAMVDLVRFEGEQQRQAKEVDRSLNWVADHEKRIRALEIQSSATTTKLSGSERVLWALISVGSSITTAVLVMALKSGAS